LQAGNPRPADLKITEKPETHRITKMRNSPSSMSSQTNLDASSLPLARRPSRLPHEAATAHRCIAPRKAAAADRPILAQQAAAALTPSQPAFGRCGAGRPAAAVHATVHARRPSLARQRC
jgi:hypothetical protein